jgi:hypothetical protein
MEKPLVIISRNSGNGGDYCCLDRDSYLGNLKKLVLKEEAKGEDEVMGGRDV